MAARDALALWLHAEVEQIHVTLDVELTPDLHEEIAELSRLRGELDAVQATVVRRQRELARHLVAEGVSYRDAARLLGVCHQRIAQLVKETA